MKLLAALALALGLGVGAAARFAVPHGGPPDAADAPRFEVDPLWPKPLPNHWLLGSVTGVAVDERDHVFVVHLTDSFNQRTEIGADASPPIGECCRPAPAVLVFDPEGNVANSWSDPSRAGMAAPQGIAVDPRGDIWIGGAGSGDREIIRRESSFGDAVHYGAPVGLTAGGFAMDTAYAGVARPAPAGGAPPRGMCGGAAAGTPDSRSTTRFGGPAGFAFDAQTGETFVADGCTNHRVVVLDRSGNVKRQWGAYGEPPTDEKIVYRPGAPLPRQFGTVRCVALANDGLLYVCDGSNDRIQVFRKDGTFVTEKQILPRTLGEGSVWGIAFSRDPQQRFLYLADGSNHRVHVLDRASLDVLTSFGAGGRYPGQFLAVHSVATDSKGNLYTAEGYEGKRIQRWVFKGVGPLGGGQ